MKDDDEFFTSAMKAMEKEGSAIRAVKNPESGLLDMM